MISTSVYINIVLVDCQAENARKLQDANGIKSAGYRQEKKNYDTKFYGQRWFSMVRWCR